MDRETITFPFGRFSGAMPDANHEAFGKYIVHQELILKPSLTYHKIYSESFIFTFRSMVDNVSLK